MEQNRFDLVAGKLDSFLKTLGLEIDKESYEYKVFCRDIAHIHIKEICQVNVDRDMGYFGDKYYLSDGESERKDVESNQAVNQHPKLTPFSVQF